MLGKFPHHRLMNSASFLPTYTGTPTSVAALRAALVANGVAKARVRLMPNGSVRLVLNSVQDRPAANAALASVHACTVGGERFTEPANVGTRCAWNGPEELFLRFAQL